MLIDDLKSTALLLHNALTNCGTDDDKIVADDLLTNIKQTKCEYEVTLDLQNMLKTLDGLVSCNCNK